MAEQQPVVAPTPPTETLAYRPVSGLAIVGLVLACVYTLIVVISTAAALFEASPFFLPAWLVLVPIAAAALSWLAQWQIRNSEGTRAGAALAKWGLWLSIFTGLGYTAYQFFTGLALTQQANAFVMRKDDDESGFFPRLQDGSPAEVNRAFLLTLPESSRGAVNPANERLMAKIHDKPGPDGKGRLSQFRDQYLVRTLGHTGKNSQVEPLGVSSWTYEKGGYMVSRNYRITTPEAVFQVLLPVHSSEGESGSQRKWFAAFPQMSMKVEYTRLGHSLNNLASLARYYLEKQLDKLNQRQPHDPFTDQTQWSEALKDKEAPEAAVRQRIEEIYKGSPGTYGMFQMQRIDHLPSWSTANQRLRLALPVRLTFRGPQDMPWTADGVARLECQQAITLDSNKLPDPGSFPREPSWKLVEIEFQNVSSAQKRAPPGR